MLRIGSLCSGAGGLDLATERVFGATTAWHCEIDDAASKVLAHRYPGVPNLGDLTEVNWGALRFHTDDVDGVSFKPDILTGGYPCQPFSHAGKRKGTDDERHIWPHVREAIRRVRPRITFLENVAGHRSLGFDRVLGDLAEDGMHVRWTSLRASDIGAPHQRERLFILVTPADTDSSAGWECSRPREAAGSRRRSEGEARQDIRPDIGSRARDAADAARDGRNEGRPESARLVGGSDAPERGSADVDLLPTPSAADGGGGHLTRSGDRSHELLLPGIARAWGHGELLATPQARDFKGVPADGFNTANLCRDVTEYGSERWGKYGDAIRRWEALTRPAPSPTEPNSKGNPRLNPAFSEWMMGWPAGWVTEVPGISRNDQLRIIGNGVVPQCAEVALRWLLNIRMEATA
jgi:DNA (cytosine-5)-methyltransferase 1